MALERNIQTISLPAAADLSTRQFHIVSIDTAGRAALAGGSVAAVIGVLQNKPSGTAHAAQVAIGGVSKLVAGGSVAAGDLIKSDANGFGVVTTTTGNTVVGRALSSEATGSGLVFECLIFPQTI